MIVIQCIMIIDLIMKWQVVFGGVIGMSQVYGVPSLACSLIMYAGIAVCSPFLAVSLFAGSSLGSFFGSYTQMH